MKRKVPHDMLPPEGGVPRTGGEAAFTRVELVVVIVVIAVAIVLSSMVLPANYNRKSRVRRLICLNNLNEIGTSDRLWPTAGHGGWADLFTNANQGALCWSNFALIGNQLGLNPKLFVCPSDERVPAKDFKTDFRDNSHLSYFVGVSTGDEYPQSIAAGDRNLGPGTVPSPDYGYSPTNGKGNDVAVPIAGPVCWSLKMHSAGNTAGAGNILLGDGSAQQVSSASFTQNWLRNANPTTNWPVGHAPAVPSIRLVFP